MPQWLVIGISGVTCGGKTTLSHNVRDYFQSKQNTPLFKTPYTIGDVQLISQDDYFLPVDDRRHEWIEKLNAINFELLTSLDMKQMLSDITWTMKGRYLVGDPTENIEYMNDMSIMTPNFELYGPSQLMPPPSAPLVQFQANKLQQSQQQHYHHTGSYYAHHHRQKPLQLQLQQPLLQKPVLQQPVLQTQQQQQPQPQQQHHHRLHQTRQHNQPTPQQQHQRHGMRISLPPVNQSPLMKLRDNKINILIIEGFMIFNQPELLTLCNIKFHLHLPYEKCYERRQRRTYEPPDVTGYFEICVWPHYEKNFSEYRNRKDIIFLNGEINKNKICEFTLQKIMSYVEERCNALIIGITPITTTLTAPSPLKMIGIHNGNNTTAKSCPMEQQ